MASIFRAQYSKIDPQKLINLKAFSLERVLEMDPEFLNTEGEHEHDKSISSISCNFEGMVNQRQLSDWIRQVITDMGANLPVQRFISCAGDNRKFVFQGVGMLFSAPSPISYGQLGREECRFVFIGKNLDKDFLRAGLMACQCTEDLRFKVGDKVYANIVSTFGSN